MKYPIGHIQRKYTFIYWFNLRVAIRKRAVRILETLILLASGLEKKTYHISPGAWRICFNDVEKHLLRVAPIRARKIKLGGRYLFIDENRT